MCALDPPFAGGSRVPHDGRRRAAARRAWSLLLLACLSAVAQAAGFAGLTLAEALQRLAARGLNIIYSSAQLQPGARVEAEPVSTEPRAILEEIVAAHGLAVVPGPDGALVLVRTAPAQAAQAAQAPLLAALAEVVVSASHYRFSLDPGPPPNLLTSGDLEMLPELGDDPVRAVARLPGVARQDFSSKPHIRGGAADETLVRFDGLRLYNPYHLKDFQNLFSTIDPRVISRLNVYSAGFPVYYGDRMSGVIDIAPLVPERPLQGSLYASFLNIGGHLAGRREDGRADWIVAARRGTLDLLLQTVEPNLGRPRYTDVYAHLGRRLSDSLAIAGNVLLSEDDLSLSDSDQEEQAEADYRDQYYWLRLDFGDAERSGGRLLAAHTRLTSERIGTADLPGVSRGELFDRRIFSIDSLQADAWWPLGGGLLQAGAEWRGLEGRYVYRDEAQFDLLFLIPGAPATPSRTRQLELRPGGDQYGAYLNWRLQPLPTMTADLGVRWDKETLSRADSTRISPRLGLLWRLGEATRVRAGWGRFFQAQGIDELPVSDGETQFFRAQRADHLVTSIERSLGAGFDLRLEGYRKTYDRLRPRYENLFDTLVVLPELKPDRARVAPVRATVDGAELSLGYDDGGGRRGWLSYGISSATDRLDGLDVHRSWDQTHSLSAGLGSRGERWDWSLAATWHSGWPTTDIELVAVDPLPLVAAGRRNARRIGTYLRLDARLARRFGFGPDNTLSVFLEVSNLSNRNNDCCVEYDIETVTGVPVLDFATISTVPIIPSLGFSWDF